MEKLIVILGIFAIIGIGSCNGQVTPDPECYHTGGTDCLNSTADCQFVSARFQWCFGCKYYVTCNFGTGNIDACENNTYYDATNGGCQEISTTCRECVIPIPVDPPADSCNSTGPRCANLTSCENLSDGVYQWCGSCQHYIRCQGSQGLLYFIRNGQVWDDNAKAPWSESSTCYECFHPCRPTVTPPDNTLPEPTCVSTGPTCVSTESFCSILESFGRSTYQYCGNCRYYLNCPGALGIPSLDACLPDTIWDDVAKACLNESTTCKECYTFCNGSESWNDETTPGPTTLEDTTVNLLTTLNPSQEETVRTDINPGQEQTNTDREQTGGTVYTPTLSSAERNKFQIFTSFVLVASSITISLQGTL